MALRSGARMNNGDRELAGTLLQGSWLLADLARDLHRYPPDRLGEAAGLLERLAELVRERANLIDAEIVESPNRTAS